LNLNKEILKLFQYISYAGEINIDKAKLFGKNIIIPQNLNLNKEILKLFQYISYAGEINIDKAKYRVIDLSIDENKSVQLKNFQENMLNINKHFNYNKYNYEANYYTKIFFEDFKKLFDNLKANNYHNECIYLILVLSVYIYIVQWNTDDPYILIKLNKLLFGRVANIGIKDIDEEIANTLTLRSIIPYDISKNKPEKITNIYEGIIAYLEYPEYKQIEPNYKTYITDFEKLFNEVLEYDIERGEYNFNLYLAFEMGLNVLTLSLIHI
jgi:hypothetical protein